MKRIVTPKYVEHVTMNVYVKDSQVSARLEPVSLAVLYAGLSPRMGMEGKNDMCMIVIVPKETGRTLP